jgi:DNA-binding response OmpR family regulator
LTVTEFRLLVCLAEKPQQVFSREQLIRIIQGYDFEGDDRVIDAHVKNVRHKIEDDPQSPVFLKTVHGAGYKFTGTPD